MNKDIEFQKPSSKQKSPNRNLSDSCPVLWRNHMILIMTLSGDQPPPLRHPPVAIVLYYLNITVEKFPVQVIQSHHNAPPHPKGTELA
jgi:hypothetical protein